MVDLMPRCFKLEMLSFFIETLLTLLKTEVVLERRIFYRLLAKETLLFFDLVLILLKAMEDYLSESVPTSSTLIATFFFLDRELFDKNVFCRELRERETFISSSILWSLLELLDSSSNSSADYSRSLVVKEFVSDFDFSSFSSFSSSLRELLFLLF